MKPKLLIAEFLLAEGLEELRDIVPEAYAMVRSAYYVFKNLTETYVLVNQSFKNLFEDVFTISASQGFLDSLEKLSKNFDYVLLIAPPNELIEASQIVGNEKILGPNIDVIKKFSLKDIGYGILKNISINVPNYIVLSNANTKLCSLKKLNFPAIVKPVDSTGGLGAIFIRNSDRLEQAVKYSLEFSKVKRVIIQSFVEGIHGSLSVIADGENVLFLTNNVQLIRFSSNGKVKYLGGIVYLRNKELYLKSLELVSKIIAEISGFRGYFGIDVVWCSWEPYVVEVNPRITTSFVGLAKIFGEKLACLMFESLGEELCKGKAFPSNDVYVAFTKHDNRIILNEYRSLSDAFIASLH